MGQIVTSTDEIMVQLGISSPSASQEALASSMIVAVEAQLAQILRYDPVLRTRTEYYTRSDFLRGAGAGSWDLSGNYAIFTRDSIGYEGDLQLKHLPIRSITQLRFNSDGRNGTRDFTSEHDKTEGTDFWANYDMLDDAGDRICHDGIVRSYGLWSSNPGSIEITYRAGYSASEFAGGGIIDASLLRQAVILEAARWTKSALLTAQVIATGGTGTTTTTTYTAGFIQSERLGDYSYTMSNSVGSRGSTSDRLHGGTCAFLPITMQMVGGFVNYALVD